jgi:hypothetical protein
MTIVWKEVLFGIFVGSVLTGISIGTSKVLVEQKGYIEGRNSVLNRLVSVGDENSPCSVQVPLPVLAEMVDAGLMRWHEVCVKGKDYGG